MYGFKPDSKLEKDPYPCSHENLQTLSTPKLNAINPLDITFEKSPPFSYKQQIGNIQKAEQTSGQNPGSTRLKYDFILLLYEFIRGILSYMLYINSRQFFKN
ncbi:hypothetical protein PN4B1_45540 [Paenibacillus naphthalenovorans]|nr:hypothetical protein PN4B1_45540 [Paenibacillus naphthalenovorans]